MVAYVRSDLEFILQQILISESHAAGESLLDLIPNPEFPFGLRTVDGTFNHLDPTQSEFGAADNTFPTLVDPVFQVADPRPVGFFGPGDPGGVAPTSYQQTSGSVFDADPRIISNLIVDQTVNNPSAYATAYDPGLDGVLNYGAPGNDDVLKDGVSIVTSPGADLLFGTSDDKEVFQFNNVTADAGLSAPFNAWMTFFGQFFDHGLDLITKGGSGTIFIPLQPDDPLYVPGGSANFLVLTRATNLPGADGIIGTADDIHAQTNTTSPFVDQNQTYSSHPSHQVFLRAYELNADGHPEATGALITNRDLGADGKFGTGDDVEIGGMATWAVVKAQARDILGINLTDANLFGVPLLATDPYGNFIKGPNGFPQVVIRTGNGLDGIAGNADDTTMLIEGDPSANGGLGISLTNAVSTGHAFLNDIAHAADPSGGKIADTDGVIGISNPNEFPNPNFDPLAPPGAPNSNPYLAQYDNELLDKHYIAGDGRVNENIGLTTVHQIFHSEHNRLVEHTKDVVLATGDVAFLNQWLLPDAQLLVFPPDQAGIDALHWNGERLFQAAKFGTEMQYQHLVFEEFARTVQPNIDAFLDFDATIDPSIVSEFANTVYRFGHSMLTETIDRLDPNFANDPMGLVQAFLNPLAFADSGPTPEEAAGAIIRGLTREVGNEIDEFVTEALRNNLLGLPLDLAVMNLARGRDTGVPTLNAARREFFNGTGDSQLKPYTSWLDFAEHIKHPESVINFVAAYGVHSALQGTGVDTLAEKRAIATALVLGGTAHIDDGTLTGYDFTADADDRFDFLNSQGIYANTPEGVTITGVDAIDLWIGGLAEEKMPFGGMLGSTFNFVFENQLENLQDGDRLYYLHRIAGLNFESQLENNTFAKLIMLNTNTTHLPGLVFSTPAYTLEVDSNLQYTGLGLDGRDDPTSDNLLIPEVIRDNPATIGLDNHYLKYTGPEHVVLGGTDANDIIISSEGDDTLYGDGGNDRLEGGYGNDQIEGGDGDDIITDIGGDDTIHGGDGNDVIHGGNGLNLILAGDGNDFIVTGDDFTEVFAGEGNDFILGARLNVQLMGGGGDDWFEIGTQDGAPGDNFADREPQAFIGGNDVFLGDGGFNEEIGEAGDDIMVGSEGPDKLLGGIGYDWGTFKDDQFGVTIDMSRISFEQSALTPSAAGVHQRFRVEGLSGSAFGDVLRGDDDDAGVIGGVGIADNTLTNISLINGLQELLDEALGAPPGVHVTSFNSGNIILGGGGSDIIEGGGGDDLIDGDKWLNVRISVKANIDGTGPEIASYDSMAPLASLMVEGVYNPGQLVVEREILTAETPSFDTAVFRGLMADYNITTDANGVTTVTDGVALRDGVDHLVHIERLQFNDGSVTLPGFEGLNNDPVGLLAISDTTPETFQTLTASIAGITDADNTATGGNITGPVAYYWQFEAIPGSGVFEDITRLADGGAAIQHITGPTFTVTPDLAGFELRVRAVYHDQNGVLETVFSEPTTAVVAGVAPPPVAALPEETPVDSTGVRFIRADLQFILDQIKIAERNAAGENLVDMLPSVRSSLGLRTVDGSYNNLVLGQNTFGGADTTFPRLTTPVFRDADITPTGFGPPTPTSYTQTTGLVFDSDPRTISNLIVDDTANNPAAVAAAAGTSGSELVSGTRTDGTTFETFFIPNVTPDAGLSAPFNAWMTFFGQFFDHGLDLVTKGGSGTVFIPLQPDDPLYVEGSPTNFMVMTRATNLPGPDGVLGTADDIHEQENTTTPFVDQNQTYSSHPSHQVFLRAYVLNADGEPVATGELITNRDLGSDGKYGTGDDVEIGGMATWAVVKAQARDVLGINLTDADVFNVPLLATDAYGNFLKGPHGLPMVMMKGLDGLGDTADDFLVEGNLASPISLVNAVRTGHQFLIDVAHDADPAGKLADTDDAFGLSNGGGSTAGYYDDEILDAHYIAGDGRVNENIGLTAVHAIFHSEHNRLVQHTKDVALASNDVAFLNQWLMPDHQVLALPTTQLEIDALVWNGERLFQAAKFGTEMQYQHLVFEEFARTIQPNIDPALLEHQNYQSEIDPSIVAEFAHTVYRFGHSMLTETVDRLDPNFQSSEIGLIQAFLNPLEYAASGPTPEQATGAIVRGLTRQVGNEIDEFVTEALRNNLVGLPLDLAALNIARGRDTGIPSLNSARREFYNGTGDSQLKPYRSWVDFAEHLRHEELLINFIAAYGTHISILNATTTAEKRDAAMLLVFGGDGAPEDRLDFLNSTGDYANITKAGADGILGTADDWLDVTVTGVDDIDFWIGGLAEEQMPFGGMLGSTFNFVFENQLEKLQNADRFYYLERNDGLNFRTELENNSFANLIMANSDATHLPNIVFKTPTWQLEVDQSLQYTGLGADGNDDPTNGDPLVPLVIRDNPDTVGPDDNYLKYTGPDHVVLGGTDGDDIILSSEGDDTLYGDGGNDLMDGGYGNDFVVGGAGDDIITDLGGDDTLHGDAGNDVIHAGNGINLVMGGFGNDFIVTGSDSSEVFGGVGNDFILGSPADEQLAGNEGDDWIERGTGDGAPGDSFDPNGLDLIGGNDLFIGTGGPDRFMGEGGDDVMFGNGGPADRYLGASGYDWAGFKDDPLGVSMDLGQKEFVAAPLPEIAATMARFAQVEGLSGSHHSDILRGDDSDATAIAAAGARGSVLTNFGLINGLRSFVGAAGNGADGNAGTADDSFGAGNIILGGGGSDFIQGAGGDDLIDGDKWLNARISVRQNADGTGPEIDSYDSMVPLVHLMLDGTYSAGQLVAVREILTDAVDPLHQGFSYDTAFFSGVRSDYTITINNNGTAGDFSDDIVTVTDTVVGRDGVDRLTHVERLQFSDQKVLLVPGLNAGPAGAVTVLDATTNTPTTTPAEGQTLRASIAGVTDADNVGAGNPTGAITQPVTFTWQVELVPGSGVFTDISTIIGGGVATAFGPTYTVSAAEVGLQIRVRAVYQDAHGTLEPAFSTPTDPVININFAPVGTVLISDTTPTEDEFLTAFNAFTDADGLTTAVFGYQWQQSADGINAWTDIPSGILPTFLPGDPEVAQFLRVVVTYTDDQGTTETVTSAVTAAVENINDVPFPSEGAAFFNVPPTHSSAAVIPSFSDDDGLPATLNYEWQELTDGTTWHVIPGAPNDTSFVPGNGLVGHMLRVRISYTDLHGTAEEVFSDVSDPVVHLNTAPIGNILISDTTPTETLQLTATPNFTDADGVPAVLAYQWQRFDGTNWIDIGGANLITFTPTQAQVNSQLRVMVTYTDLGGELEHVFSAATVVTGDFINDGNGGNTLNGNEGQDIIFGNGGADTLNGNGEDDLLDGGAGGDTLNGGAGADTLTGGAGNDNVNGGGGNDTIVYAIGDGADTTNGNGGTDTMNITGGAANDTAAVVFSGTTITEVNGGAVTNVEAFNLNLGGGNNTLEYDPAGGAITTANVVVNLTAGTASGFASVLNVQNANGGSGNDQFTGNAAANTFNGGAGNDTFFATVGDGNDTYNGGGGTDTYNLAATTAAATITLAAASSAQTGSDVLSGIENFIGSQGNDAITVNGGVNVIDGQGGNDTINAGGGNDTVLGGAGNDTIQYVVGDGADTVDGGANTDTFQITASGGADTLNVVFNGVRITGVAGGTLANIESVTANLGNGTDTLDYGATTAAVTVNLATGAASGFTSITSIENVTGGSGNDVLTSGAGANTLVGAGGDDRFVATVNDGNDTFTGGGGSDTLDLSGTTAAANVTTGAASSAQIGNDVLNSIENLIGTSGNDTINFGAGVNVIDGRGGNDTINSGSGADIILGGLGNDTIDAGSGADTITGGAGDDVMDGGTGADTFVFGSGFGQDRISGFTAGGGNQDHLRLDPTLGITALNFGAHVSISANGANTVIMIDGNDTITLLGIAPANVTVADFLFGP